MKMYTPKPQPIEALLWNGQNLKAFDRWLGNVLEVDICNTRNKAVLVIADPMDKEDFIMAYLNFYVIKRTDGTIEVCDKKLFEQMFEELCY